MRRIAIIGNAGGGKSILAHALGRALQLPVHVVDDVQWRPGWAPAPPADVAAAHERWLAGDRWIIDGWGSWELLALRFDAAELIVLVDFPLRVHYRWALRRQLEASVGLRRDWPPPGCKAWPVTGRLLRVMRRVHTALRPELLRLLDSPRYRDRVAHLRSPRELRAFRERMLEGA